ncbi:MAG TPA: hypothetical protein GXX29_11765 [Firmicutes bacterium]|nr:hypothetical protein [Bacillota bacterium]
MACVLLANIGNSDVQIDGQPLKPFRDQCRLWFDLLCEHKDEEQPPLQLPILEPTLRYIERETGALPDKVVLFVTDQPEGTPESERAKDTYWGGRLIKLLLAGKMDVELEVIAQNPSDYSGMHLWYRERLPQLFERLGKELGRITRLYAQLTGGAPACNTELALSLVDLSPITFRTLYVSRATGEVTRGNYGATLRATQILNLLHVLIKRDDYPAALALVKESLPHALHLQNLLKAAHARQLFRFIEAEQLMKRAWPKGYRERVEALAARMCMLHKAVQDRDVFQPTHDEARKNLLGELWYHARRSYELEDYVEFVARFWCLRELLLRYRAEQHKGERLPFTGSTEVVDEYVTICHRIEGPNSRFMLWVNAGKRLRSVRHGLPLIHNVLGVGADEMCRLWCGQEGIIEDTELVLQQEFGVDVTPAFVEMDKLVMEIAEGLLWKDVDVLEHEGASGLPAAK